MPMVRNEKSGPPVVLTIAGFDPSGGAGIIADIKAFTHFGCAPTAAVTSVTFQNAAAMSGAAHQTAETVRSQIMSVLAAQSVAAVKTGMLPTPAIVQEVVRLFRETNLPAPVVDPVMRSSSGYDLMDADAWGLLLSDLLPLTRVITPNIPEAERITGFQISDEEEMRRAANRMREMGARAILIKGGHLGERSETRAPRSVRGNSPAGRGNARQAIDLLDEAGEVTVFRGEWIEGSSMRGTGCLLSAAITACLAKGMTLKESVAAARNFVAEQRAKGKEQRAKG